jgi:hypothetical protein
VGYPFCRHNGCHRFEHGRALPPMRRGGLSGRGNEFGLTSLSTPACVDGDAVPSGYDRRNCPGKFGSFCDSGKTTITAKWINI